MFKKIAIASVGLMALTASALAQGFPARPIKVILPFAAGTGSDVSTRLILEFMSQKTGATLLVENRAGALSIIGTQAALRAPADGYTFMMSGASSHSLAPSLSKEATYDPIKDFDHIGILALIPSAVLVPADSKYKTVADLVQDAQVNSGKLRYAYASGSTQIAGAKFHQISKLNSVAVPYKSSQDALSDLIGNRIDYMVIDGASAANLAKDSGSKVRVVLVIADGQYNLLPGIPAMKEAGFPPIQVIGWTGIAAPAGIPAEAKQWFKTNMRAALTNPELKDKLQKMATDPAPDLDAEKFVAEQLKSWSEAAKEAGVTPQ